MNRVQDCIAGFGRHLGGLLLLAVLACGGGGGAAPSPARVRGDQARLPRGSAVVFPGRALMRDVEWLCAPARRGRGSLQPGAAVAADYVAREFRRAGLAVVRQRLENGAENIIGVARGDDRAVIVSAHHDHLGVDEDGIIYPGADDNASGVAVLLALARDAARRRFAHSVLFISFGAEELGLLGSAAYVQDPLVPLAQTIAVINFDMVGRNFFEAGANQAGACAAIGLEDLPGAKGVVAAASQRVGLKLIPVPAPLLAIFGYANRTDDWWFRRHGVPAVHFSTGLHDDYHQPSDTPDKLVPDQLGRVATIAAELIRYLAGGGSSEPVGRAKGKANRDEVL